nr:MAG TPA: hypothetical protein [Caudoviricetes sp.]
MPLVLLIVIVSLLKFDRFSNKNGKSNQSG